MHRRSAGIALPVILLLLLCGCATRQPAEPGPSGSTSAAPGRLAVRDLFGGFWRVRDAADIPDATWVQFGDSGAEVDRPKGLAEYAMRSRADQLVASLTSWSGGLGNEPEAPWLGSAAGVARLGSDPVLVDPSGAVLARLVRDGKPRSTSQYLVEDFPKHRTPDATPGPGVVDVTATSFVGTWRLADHPDATVRFTAGGTWSNHPTCDSGTGANGLRGAWRLLPGGFLLATAGGQTEIGCMSAVSPSPDRRAITDVGQAGSLRIHDGRLTLFDQTGKPLGTLVR